MAPRSNSRYAKKIVICKHCKDVNPSHGPDDNCSLAPKKAVESDVVAVLETTSRQPSRSTTIFCSYCDGVGHLRATCFKLVCERCGNQGHNEHNCDVSRHDFFCTNCRNYRKHSVRECLLIDSKQIASFEEEAE